MLASAKRPMTGSERRLANYIIFLRKIAGPWLEVRAAVCAHVTPAASYCGSIAFWVSKRPWANPSPAPPPPAKLIAGARRRSGVAGWSRLDFVRRSIGNVTGPNTGLDRSASFNRTILPPGFQTLVRFQDSFAVDDTGDTSQSPAARKPPLNGHRRQSCDGAVLKVQQSRELTFRSLEC